MAFAHHATRRRARLRLEALEDRSVPSATLIKDVNRYTADALPLLPVGTACAVGTMVYFAADDGVRGVELWKSDGTATGTVLVKDINTTRPALLSFGPPSSYPSSLTRVGNAVFFLADDGVHGIELWRSDGTAAGTRMVKDIVPVQSNTAQPPVSPRDLTDVNGTLYFTAPSGAGVGLWKSDGTGVGTVLVRAYSGAGPFPSVMLGKPIGFQGAVYFSAPGEDGANRLWKTNGTPAGTAVVADVTWPGPSMTVYNGKLYFAGTSPLTGTELYSTDGTASGTRLVKDVNPAPGDLFQPVGSSYPAVLTVANGLLFFRANDGVTGDELWCSDGTAAGTRLVKDIAPGQPSPSPISPFPVGPNGSMPDGLTEFRGQLYFAATDPEHGTELWRSDGTADGTTLVQDLYPGSYPDGGGPLSSYPSQLTVAGGNLYLTASDAAHGGELWKTDGVTPGLALVKDITPDGLTIAFPRAPGSLVAAGGILFFGANDGVAGFEPWRTDGSTAGTKLIRDVNANTLPSLPAEVATVGGVTYFVADDGLRGPELWRIGGAGGAATLVKDLLPGNAGSQPRDLVGFNGMLYFTANDGVAARLYRSDGTATGTTVVSNLGFVAPSRPFNLLTSIDNLTVFQGRLLFTFSHDTVTDLYSTDGTAAGTKRLFQFPTAFGIASPVVNGFTAVGGTLFFAAASSETGLELWRTDSTAAGTRLVKDIRPGSFGANPSRLVALGNKLLFTADDGVAGYELWRSDGTAAGTVRVKDINPGINGAFDELFLATPERPLVVGGVAYFSANDGVRGAELWKTDGTAAGTTLVKDIYPGSASPWPGWPATPNSSQVAGLTAFQGAVYFTATNGPSGAELWKSDGTAKGTVLVKDIFPGRSAPDPMTRSIYPNSALPSDLTVFAGRLYFTADDGAHGRELWATDGSAAGTKLVAEINPGPAAGAGTGAFFVSRRAVWSAGGQLLLVGIDDAHGAELWKYNPPPANRGPVASAGRAYDLSEGQGLTLNARASFDPDGDPLTYRWDVNGDGVFTDATGVAPTLNWARLRALGLVGRPAAYTVRVRVEDGRGGVAVSATSLTLRDRPLTGTGLRQKVTLGQDVTAPLAFFTDPGGAEPVGNYTARVSWGDGGTAQAASVTLAPDGRLRVGLRHRYGRRGTYQAKVTIQDQGGAPLVLTCVVEVA